jgi:hypothetical protein
MVTAPRVVRRDSQSGETIYDDFILCRNGEILLPVLTDSRVRTVVTLRQEIGHRSFALKLIPLNILSRQQAGLQVVVLIPTIAVILQRRQNKLYS